MFEIEDDWGFIMVVFSQLTTVAFKGFQKHMIATLATLCLVTICHADSDTRSRTTNITPETIHFFDLNTDPGWTCEGEWAFGVPQGLGSGCGDPTSGYTGMNVYGYNLYGDYSNFMWERYLTTTALDCSGYENIQLQFQRWLGLQWGFSLVQAWVDVSSDGQNWQTAWSYGDGNGICDGVWTQMTYDISETVDDCDTVFIRWGLGHSYFDDAYPGWNIDDIALLGTPVDELMITPRHGLSATGYESGPFSPYSMVCTLHNRGDQPFSWEADITNDWLTISQTSGELAPGVTKRINFLLTATADTLSPGEYISEVRFTNTDSGIQQTRICKLNIQPVPGNLVIFDSVAPDYDHQAPFGDVLTQQEQTETITLYNTNTFHSITVTDLAFSPYYETFGDGLAQGWVEKEGNWMVSNGKYTCVPSNGWGYVYYKENTYRDMAIQADIQREGSNYSIASIYFRASSDVNFWNQGSAYVFEIRHNDRSFRLFKQIVRDEIDIRKWTYSSNINTNRNRVMITAEGTNIHVYINGHLEWSGSDSSLTEGHIGLISNPTSKYDASHYFDNIIISRGIPDGPSLSPVQIYSCFDDKAHGFDTPQLLPDSAPGLTSLTTQTFTPFELSNIPETPFIIPPSSSVTLSLKCAPTVPGSYSTKVIIMSNDKNNSRLTVDASATAAQNFLVVNGVDKFSSEGHPGGPFTPSQTRYTLYNTGANLISWTATPSEDWIRVSPSSGQLSAGRSISVNRIPNTGSLTTTERYLYRVSNLRQSNRRTTRKTSRRIAHCN